MHSILILGAGRSASWLIKYFLTHSAAEQWKITIADISMELAQHKTNNHPNARAIALDLNNQQLLNEEIKKCEEYY